MSRTSTPSMTNEPPLPPRERGTGRAILLALLMHALLALFLYHGVQWPNSTPAGSEAELWTMPDVVTPPPPAPPTPVVAPPPPVDEQAEIALQQQKQREAQARQAALDAARQARLDALRQADEKKRAAALAAAAAATEAAHLAEQKAAERQRLQAQEQLKQLQRQKQLDQQKQLEEQKLAEQKAAQDAQRKAAADKAAAAKAAAAKARAAQAAANAQLNNERASRLAQLQGLASGEGLSNTGSGNGSGGNAASPGYPDKVRRVVKPNISYGGETDGLTTIVIVHCAPSGTVLSVSVIHRSSNPVWDSAVVDAVRASSPLPPDVDGKTPANIRITFHASEGG